MGSKPPPPSLPFIPIFILKSKDVVTRGRRHKDRRSTMSVGVPKGVLEEQREMKDRETSPGEAEEAKLKATFPHLEQKPSGFLFFIVETIAESASILGITTR